MSSPHVSVILSPMTAADIPTVADIARACFHLDEAVKICSGYLGQPHRRAIVAKMDEKVVGFLEYEVQADKIYVNYLAVAPGRQSNGIGGNLMSWLLAQAPICQRSLIELHVRKDNWRARAFYSRLGFQCAPAKHAVEKFFEMVLELQKEHSKA